MPIVLKAEGHPVGEDNAGLKPACMRRADCAVQMLTPFVLVLVLVLVLDLLSKPVFPSLAEPSRAPSLSSAILVRNLQGGAHELHESTRMDSVRPAISRVPGVRAAGGAFACQDRRTHARQPRRRRGGRDPFVWIRAIRGLPPEDCGPR